MNVSLTPDLERFVVEEVQCGTYSSQSEVVRAGLRLLAERKRILEAQLTRLRGEIAEGLEEARRGDLVDGEEAFDWILRRSRAASDQG